MTHALLLALTITGSGCSATPEPATREPVRHELAPAAVPTWLELDPVADAGGFRIGDGAVFTLRLRDGASTQHWFVTATLAAHHRRNTAFSDVTFPSGRYLKFETEGLVRFHLRVANPDGTLVGESITAPIPTASLKLGLTRAAAFCTAHPNIDSTRIEAAIDAVSDADRRDIVISFSAIHVLVELVLRNESLAPLLQQCIRRPSFSALVTGFLARTKVLFDVKAAKPHFAPLPVPATRAFEIPLHVEAFNEVVLRGSALVADSPAPIHLSAGIVSLVGTHPDHPDHSAQLRLLRFGRLSKPEIRRIIALEKATPVD